MEMNEWVGKKARISLSNGLYYKGKVLSVGDTFLKILDFRSKTVFIRIEFISLIEEWGE